MNSRDGEMDLIYGVFDDLMHLGQPFGSCGG